MVAGSPGGSTIPTTVLQIITNVIDYEMDIGLAVDAGRFHHQWMPDQISIEKAALNSNNNSTAEPNRTCNQGRSLIGRVNAIHISLTAA